MNGTTRAALVTLCTIVPLYGTLGQLDGNGPPVPPLVPAPVALAVLALALVALALLVPPALRVARRDALTFGFLSAGIANIVAAIPGFEPVSGTLLGMLVLAFGCAGLVLTRAADARTLRWCLRGWLVSATLAGLVALALELLRRPAALFAYNNGRAVGTFLNPNELAAFALVSLGLAAPLALRSRGRDRLATAATLVLACALVATFSRWGALCAVGGVAAYALATGGGRRAQAALAVVALAAATFLVWDASGGRHHNPRDTEARAVAWRTGVTTFLRFPLLGTGPLAYAKTYDVLRPPDAPGPKTPVAFDPHSLLLAFAAEGGLVAVIVLIASAAILLRALRVAGLAASGTASALALGAFAGIVALLAHSLINTISLTFPLGLQAAGLALGLARTAERPRA